MSDADPEYKEPELPKATWMEEQLEKAGKMESMSQEDCEAVIRAGEPEPPKLRLGKGARKNMPLIERVPAEAARYLGALRVVPAPRMAREAAGVNGVKVASWRRQIRGFSALEQEAMRDAADTLLASAYNRAVNGVLKPVYQHGMLVGYERVYSDKLAEVLLKGMHEMFRPVAEEAKGSTTNIVITDPAVIGDIVRRLSPTSQPKVIECGPEKTVA